MRIDNQPPPINTVRERREVKGLTAVYVVKPVVEEAHPQQQSPSRHEAERDPPRQIEQRGYEVDRRKICRRVSKQAVLIELRSGRDRRRVDQREGDVRIHIDAQA